MLVFSRTATRAEVLEEIKHLKQHKSLKFASLSTEQIIQLEIEAQQQLSRYAKMKGWSDAELKHGTFHKLISIGIAGHDNSLVLKRFPELKPDRQGWMENYVRFKLEDQQINIQLGTGKGLGIFNEGIINFEFVQINKLKK